MAILVLDFSSVASRVAGANVIMETMAPDREICIKRDPSVKDGFVVVDTDEGVVRMSVSVFLNYVRFEAERESWRNN